MTENIIPEKGLIIGPKWADLIVTGEKPWELRKRATNIRGRIAIIAQGTGTIVGTAKLVDCIGPLDHASLMLNRKLACETEAEIVKDIKDGYVFAWVMQDPVKFAAPMPYKHPSGAVTWVNLSNPNSKIESKEMTAYPSNFPFPSHEAAMEFLDKSMQRNLPEFRLTCAPSLEKDFERVGNQLSAHTLKKGAPAYNPTSQTFTALSPTGEILGEAIVTQNWGKLELDMLHVNPENRGKGIGTVLMSAVEEFARAKELTAIRLNTPTWQGVGFYERRGYTLMGCIPLAPDNNGNPQAEATYFKILKHG